jgi:Mlc titration factor MtfA (ptsG expression regulator)
MTSDAIALLLVCSAALIFSVWMLGQPYVVAWRRQRVQRQAFPASWRKILRRRVPLVRRLPAELQLQLKKHMQVFIAEKSFIGCAGLVITDEMRVVIAAQACLLILNRPTGYFRDLRQILVYPGAFVVKRPITDETGVQQERREALTGESWSEGQVVLSWQDSLDGAAVADDGMNVVIHEFSHQLDQESGAANGAPPRSPGDRDRHDPQRWSRVFREAYAGHKADVRFGHEGLLDPYGAKDPAEFFAVVSEVFFEQPRDLQRDYPALYLELSGYYRVDPAQW